MFHCYQECFFLARQKSLARVKDFILRARFACSRHQRGRAMFPLRLYFQQKIRPIDDLLDRMPHRGVSFLTTKLPYSKLHRGSAPPGDTTTRAQREATLSDNQDRITAMHQRDVRVAWVFVVALWLAMIFVAAATWSLAPNSEARIVLLIGGAIVLLFNTAAIAAMLKHYREDRDFIYGLDIKFLDAMQNRKG
jgi:hypothetical protein